MLARDAERQAKEAERQAKEIALREKEAERQAKEAALQEKTAALAEIERLKALLQGTPPPDRPDRQDLTAAPAGHAVSHRA